MNSPINARATPVSEIAATFGVSQPTAFKWLARRLSLRHIRTRPYTPKTNTKSLPRT